MNAINILVAAFVSIVTTVFVCGVTLSQVHVKDGEHGLPGPQGPKGDKGDKGEPGKSYKTGAGKVPIYPPSVRSLGEDPTQDY